MSGTSPIQIDFVGIRPFYEQGVIARFAMTLAPEVAGMPELHATTSAIVRRPVGEVHVIGERMLEDGSRVVDVSIRNRTYRWGFRLSAVGVRADGGRIRASRTVGFARCRETELAWLEERRNVQNDERYDTWLRAHRASGGELERQRRMADRWIAGDGLAPLVSIVTPVYRTPAAYLREMVDSVLAQTYPNFELVLANASGECAEVDEVLAAYDDERIRVIEIENRSIAENTNEGISVAAGDFIAFVDHDDLLEPDALFRYVEAIRARPEADLLFCDEDMWGIPDDERDDESAHERFFGPKFKPGWNPSRLLDGNIICHMLMVSRHALEQVDLTPPELTGAQDYDLTLKAWEVARDVVHVPRMLYHWRSYPESSATNLESKPYLLEAGRAAVQAHFDRAGIEAKVEPGIYPLTYRTRFEGDAHCSGITSLPLKPAALSDGRLPDDAETLILIDGDAQFGADDLREIADALARPEVGIAAPITLDPDGLVASAGLTVCPDGTRTPMSAGLTYIDIGYSQFLCCNHDCSAVAPSMFAMRAETYRQLGGFDAELAREAGIEAAVVDLCLRVREAGMVCCVVASSHVRMPSTGADHSSGAAELLARHPQIADGDPHLGAHLDPASPFYQLAP